MLVLINQREKQGNYFFFMFLTTIKIVDINLYKYIPILLLFWTHHTTRYPMSKITASNINKKIKEITDMIDFNTKTVKK
jgi:hypothetical protein